MMEMGIVGLIGPTAAGNQLFCVLGPWLNVLPFFLDVLCFASDS